MAKVLRIIFLLVFSILIGLGGYYQLKHHQFKEELMLPMYTFLKNEVDVAEIERIYYDNLNRYLGSHGVMMEDFFEFLKDGKYLIDLARKETIGDDELVQLFKLRQKVDSVKATHNRFSMKEPYDLETLENQILNKKLEDNVLKRFYASILFRELSDEFQPAIYESEAYYFPKYHNPHYIFNATTGCYKILLARPHPYYQHLILGDAKYSYDPTNRIFETITIHKNEIKDNKLDIVLHSDMFGYKKKMSLDLPLDTDQNSNPAF